ncbi:MAG: hypothetical protein AAB345_02450 [Patescibacteria group bacterium]
METKLKSIFLNPQLRLAFKATLFLGFLILARLGGFSLISTPIFIAGAVVLYARPLFRTVEKLGDFLVLVFSAVVFNLVFIDSLDFFFSAVYYSLLFFLLVGVKDLILINRGFWSLVLNFGLAYPIFLIFFQGNSAGVWWKPLVLFLLTILLIKDALKKNGLAAPFSLLVTEVAWASSFLPIGFIGLANLNFLFYATTLSLLEANERGLLDRKKILSLLSVFTVLLLAILGLSGWSF